MCVKYRERLLCASALSGVHAATFTEREVVDPRAMSAQPQEPARAGGRDEGGARGMHHETNMLDEMIHLLYFRVVRRRPGGLLPDRTGSVRASALTTLSCK